MEFRMNRMFERLTIPFEPRLGRGDFSDDIRRAGETGRADRGVSECFDGQKVSGARPDFDPALTAFGHHDQGHRDQAGAAAQGLTLDTSLPASDSHHAAGISLVEIDIGSRRRQRGMVAKWRCCGRKVHVIQPVDSNDEVRHTDFEQPGNHCRLMRADLRSGRGSLRSGKIQGNRGALDPGRNRTPPRVDHQPRSETEVLGRNPGGAPRSIRAERRIPTIRVAIREANTLLAFGRQGKDAIRTNSAPPITESANDLGRTFQASGPLPESKHEIVSGPLDLEQVRCHGAAPMTTAQLAASLLLPAASLATTR